MMEKLFAEDVLFLKAGVLTQCLEYIHIDIVEVIVLLNVGAELHDRVDGFDDNGVVAILVIQHRIEKVPLLIILIAERRVYVVENLYPLDLAHLYSWIFNLVCLVLVEVCSYVVRVGLFGWCGLCLL